MDLRVHERRARVVVAPGYHITYTYGEHQLGSIEITRLAHEALVPASARAAAVVAERHVSPRKAQAAAASAVIAAKAAVAAAGATSAAQLATSIATVDTAFYAFIAASVAGLLARSLTALLRERHAAQIESRADAMRDAYMRGGLNAGSVESEQDLWLRADLEWHRWAESEREDWHADKRRAWAERLFREQHLRRCEHFVSSLTWPCAASIRTGLDVPCAYWTHALAIEHSLGWAHTCEIKSTTVSVCNGVPPCYAVCRLHR